MCIKKVSELPSQEFSAFPQGSDVGYTHWKHHYFRCSPNSWSYSYQWDGNRPRLHDFKVRLNTFNLTCAVSKALTCGNFPVTQPLPCGYTCTLSQHEWLIRWLSTGNIHLLSSLKYTRTAVLFRCTTCRHALAFLQTASQTVCTF